VSTFPVSPIDDLVFVSPELSNAIVQQLDPRVALRGRVLAVGPGRRTSDGVLVEPDVKVGDVVRLAPGKAIEAVFDQRRVWVSRERELLAVES
jgi:co-chaperonin GroES (HSP10)